ncbi:MAG: nucleotidyltransferase family protein [Bacteroidetes bacterium]|nr:nucleotidyltransferase family protein [Bacteroidota bacterium]
MKNLNEIKKILKKNKTYLRKKYSVEEIGIFGSFSRGNQNSRSDIDLMVSLKKPLGLEFVDLSLELQTILNHKVDLVSKNALKKRMLVAIKDEVIYV